jgi:hypothetical protein
LLLLRYFQSKLEARPAGVEPTTGGLEIRCSIQLSYGRSLAKHDDCHAGGVEARDLGWDQLGQCCSQDGCQSERMRLCQEMLPDSSLLHQHRSRRSREGVMHYASKMSMGKTIEGFSGVGRFWGVSNRVKLPLSKPVRVEVAEPVLVHFQRIARRFIQSQMKASFLWKRSLGKRVHWRRYRCGRPARVLVGNPVQWLRVGEWAEGEFYRRVRASGLPF